MTSGTMTTSVQESEGGGNDEGKTASAPKEGTRPSLKKRTSSKNWKLVRDSFVVRRDRRRDLWDAILSAIGESKEADAMIATGYGERYTFVEFQKDLDILMRRLQEEGASEEECIRGGSPGSEGGVVHDDETIDERPAYRRTFRRKSIVKSLDISKREIQSAKNGDEDPRVGSRQDGNGVPIGITPTSHRFRVSDLTDISFRTLNSEWASEDSTREMTMDGSDSFRLNGRADMIGTDSEGDGEEAVDDLCPSNRLVDQGEGSLMIDDFSSSIQPRSVRFVDQSEGSLMSGNASSSKQMKRLSSKRQALSFLDANMIFDMLEISEMRNAEAFKDWASSFYHLDPRWQILTFFNDLALEGANNLESTGIIPSEKYFQIPFILRIFGRAGVFSVWRPTSNDAIRKMMTGEGVGKGLDIKGKSALKGKYSGFVPFMQIHNNKDKSKVCSMTTEGRVRVFFPNKLSRDRAARKLLPLRDVMVQKTKASQTIIEDTEEIEAKVLSYTMQKSFSAASAYKRQQFSSQIKKVLRESNRLLNTGPMKVERGRFQEALEDKSKNMMSDPNIYEIDEYASDEQGVYGLDLPEKLFWVGFVEQNDITRKEGSEYDTGRPSMPEFQSMNFDSLRKKPERHKKQSLFAAPRPVLYHAGCGSKGGEPIGDSNPLCPLDLLMAYEESDGHTGKVTPVVSDFDCFLLGTRGVQFKDHLGKQELSMMASCVDGIEGILETPQEGVSWTKRWLEVKKHHDEDKVKEMPQFGYADNRSYTMISGAVHRLRRNGAVRHGPECFNYGFPQDLDDKYLVISDTFPGQVPWKYVDSAELISILSEKIDMGFTFPLNPKWVLCDAGWKGLYDKLLASQKPNVQDSMAIWYPETIRSRIDHISTRFPLGFGRSDDARSGSSESIDLAEFELKRSRLGKKSFAKVKFLLANRQKRLEEDSPTLFSKTLDMLEMGREADKKQPRQNHRGMLCNLSEHSNES